MTLAWARRTANRMLGSLGFRIERIPADTRAASASRFLAISDPVMTPADRETNRLLNVIGYTKTSASPYSAGVYESAYHSIEIGGRKFKGQREPRARLDITPFDFTGKAVLDIGCNQGGMIYAVADRIRLGMGIDFDSRMINAANRIRASRGDAHLHFYVFDLEREPLALLDHLRPETPIDIVFLLSVCMWITNWRDVIAYARRIAPAMLFESNGSDLQQQEQEAELRRVYPSVQLLQESSPDDAGQTQRKLFLCRV